MDHRGKTKKQLIAELEEAERRIAQLQSGQAVNAPSPLVAATTESRLAQDDRNALPDEADELLRKSEERYRAFVDQCADGIWLIEMATPISIDLPEDQQIEAFYRHGHLTKCNDAMAQMYGLATAAQLQGALLRDLLIPSDPHNQDFLRAFIRCGYRLVNAESHEVDAQGQPKYFANNLMGLVENGYLARAWGTQRDITATKVVDEALRHSESRFRTLAETASDAIITIDETSRILFINRAAENIFGYALAEMLGQDLTMLMPDYLRQLHHQGFQRYQATGERHISWAASELPGLHKNGTEIPLQISFGETTVNGERLFTGIVRDITAEKRAQEMARGQQNILALIAKGAPLSETLTELARFVERLSERAWCSILLLDEENGTLRHGAAPSLPDEYTAAIDGIKIGLTVGSCGAAAYRKQIYIAADLENDPNWAEFKHLALPHGLRACWSRPILNEDGRVLGTFALYYGEPCAPTEADCKLIEMFTSLAAIAIERYVAEEHLRDSENRYRALYENNPLMVFTVDSQGTILTVNEFGAQQLGYSAPELIGQSGSVLFHPADQDAALQEIVQCLRHPEAVFQWEISKVHQDGRSLWVKENARAVRRANGKLAVLIVSEDITWRKQAEEALRLSETKFRNVAESTASAMFIFHDGHLLYVNPATEHILGYSQTELLTMPVTDVIHPDFQALYFARAEAIQHGSHMPFRAEYKLFHKNGTERWVDVTFGDLVTMDAQQVVIGTAYDITERKLAEEALRQSEAKFRNVAESTASAMLIHRNGELIYVNPATERITGYTQEELLGMNLLNLIHPAFRSLYFQRTEARKRGEQIGHRCEYKLLHKSGAERWVDFTFGGFVHLDSQQATIGTAYDITDRKQAEELLIAEKERLAVTLRSIGDGVIATDTNGHIVLLNRVAESLTGWPQEEAMRQHLDTVFQIVNAKSHASLESMFAKALQREQVFENQENILLISRDGTERLIAATTAPIYDSQSCIIGVVLVFRDLSEELKRDEEILKATKLESIALLAGGIAHDFNNFLTAILGNISLAKQYIEPSSRAYARLQDSEQATMRARDLTQQLLTFASGGAPIKKTASLANLLRESISFALTGSNVRSKIVLSADLWLAEIDEGQINQVLHNLVLNARQAMPLGGTIEITAENVTVEEGGFIEGAYLPPPRYVKLTVKDSGVGIAEEHLSKIFDPYFTTKQKGSGLGLATAYSIIKNHGGYIFVESDIGSGTTFSLYLPASEKRATQKNAAPRLNHSAKGRILIMDDEPALRKMISEILKYLGYEAAASQNGEEALALYRQALDTGQPFDAVILDLTVPGAMGGKETAEQLRALDATAKCIVSSGYSNDPVMAEYHEHGFVAVIAKPYQIAQLSEVLKQVVGDPSTVN
ncbi:MAG: PAS domain S-box protein [Acidobacteria bacterium]|nr:PAS domain S-box protein [Acidobacteriota bacterium]